MEELACWVRETSSPGTPCVVLGDLNCVAGSEPRGAARFLGCDLEALQRAPRPTWDPATNCWACEEQPKAIDRILLDARSARRLRCAVELAFTEPSSDGTPLSDHYGLRVRLAWPSHRASAPWGRLLASLGGAFKMPRCRTLELAAQVPP